jgi:hypothetical protein
MLLTLLNSIEYVYFYGGQPYCRSEPMVMIWLVDKRVSASPLWLVDKRVSASPLWLVDKRVSLSYDETSV